MPRPLSFTIDTLLAYLRPGCIYAVHNLAQRRDMSPLDIKVMMMELVNAGKVSIIKVPGRKNQNFILTGTEHLRRQPPSKLQIDPALVAQPRRYAVLTGEIAGYEAEINRRAELAMMTRAR